MGDQVESSWFYWERKKGKNNFTPSPADGKTGLRNPEYHHLQNPHSGKKASCLRQHFENHGELYAHIHTQLAKTRHQRRWVNTQADSSLQPALSVLISVTKHAQCRTTSSRASVQPPGPPWTLICLAVHSSLVHWGQACPSGGATHWQSVSWAPSVLHPHGSTQGSERLPRSCFSAGPGVCVWFFPLCLYPSHHHRPCWTVWIVGEFHPWKQV